MSPAHQVITNAFLCLARAVPAPVGFGLKATIFAGALLVALSATGAFEERFTPAPALPALPALPSAWLLGRGAALDDAACQLSLRVLDESGHAVHSARVSVAEMKNGSVARTFEALTDRKGTHRVLDLPAGFYDVTVDVEGKALQGTPTFDCKPRPDTGQRAFFDVVVAHSDHRVSGRLFGRHRQPLAWSGVAVYQDEKHRRGLGGAVHVRTDADGNFSVRLAAGDYVVYATAADHVPRKSALHVEQAVTTLKLALAFSPAVRGFVVDEQGRPLQNAQVAIANAWDPRRRSASVSTNAEGFFSLPVQEGQELSLTARGQGRIGRGVFGVVDNVDRFLNLTLVATKGRSVSGTVFSPTGAPLAFGGVHYRIRSLGLEGEAPTDGSGRFLLDGMPADEDVEVWAIGNATGAWGAQVATPSTTRLALIFIPPAW